MIKRAQARFLFCQRPGFRQVRRREKAVGDGLKRIENLLSLSEQHRELWKTVPQRKDLARIFQTGAEVLLTPATVEETEFLNLVIVHFQTGWWIAKTGGMTTLKELTADARSFFTLPLPRAVWEKTKALRNQRFVRFVEKAVKSGF